jgi:DeoR family transcriptional regulator, aga operon transcriptional repressor
VDHYLAPSWSPNSHHRTALTGISVLDQERRRAILELLSVEGRVLTTELSHRLRTSQVTIRKDLDFLHRERRLHRAHGGALPLGEFWERPAPAERAQPGGTNGQSIADAAVGLIGEKQVVVLDSGSISVFIARRLNKFQNLTVVTNAMNIAAELAGTSIQVILAGGKLCNRSCSFVGPIAEEMLQDLSADLFFLEAEGIDISFGLSAPTLPQAEVNRAMIRISRRVVAVCDSTAIGKRGFGIIAPLTALHHLVTDYNIFHTHLSSFRENGIEVSLA